MHRTLLLREGSATPCLCSPPLLASRPVVRYHSTASSVCRAATSSSSTDPCCSTMARCQSTSAALPASCQQHSGRVTPLLHTAVLHVTEKNTCFLKGSPSVQASYPLKYPECICVSSRPPPPLKRSANTTHGKVLLAPGTSSLSPLPYWQMGPASSASSSPRSPSTDAQTRGGGTRPCAGTSPSGARWVDHHDRAGSLLDDDDAPL